MQHAELTEKIIGCAFRVHNTMGFGFLEAVYERCLPIDFGPEPVDVKEEGAGRRTDRMTG